MGCFQSVISKSRATGFGPVAATRDVQLLDSRNLVLTVPSAAYTKTVSPAYGGGTQV
jgi:hypothetical protein